jgi:hypothetical protein
LKQELSQDRKYGKLSDSKSGKARRRSNALIDITNQMIHKRNPLEPAKNSSCTYISQPKMAGKRILSPEFFDSQQRFAPKRADTSLLNSKKSLERNRNVSVNSHHPTKPLETSYANRQQVLSNIQSKAALRMKVILD